MLIKVSSFSVNMLCFVKVQSMHIHGIFIMKSHLLNIFNGNDKLGLDTVS